MSRVTREGRIRNEYVSNSIGIATIVDKMKDLGVWWGKKIRSSKSFYKNERWRKKRRPKNILLDKVESDMRAAGMWVSRKGCGRLRQMEIWNKGNLPQIVRKAKKKKVIKVNKQLGYWH